MPARLFRTAQRGFLLLAAAAIAILSAAAIYRVSTHGAVDAHTGLPADHASNVLIIVVFAMIALMALAFIAHALRSIARHLR